MINHKEILSQTGTNHLAKQRVKPSEIQASQPELGDHDIGMTIKSNKMIINKFNTKMINHIEIPNQTEKTGR